MKILHCLIAITFLISCSKTESDFPVDQLPTSGAVHGTLKAFDRYGNENSNYNDVAIKLIDNQGMVSNALINSNGTFHFENIPNGNIILAIAKPGYGFMDSVKYKHQTNTDTLSDIFLIEELPFSCQLSEVSFLNSTFTYKTIYSYKSTEAYMVSEFYCFSRKPSVSVNDNSLLWITPSQTNVSILSLVGASSFSPFTKFVTAGFQEGEQIYVTVIPGIAKLGQIYNDPNRNYEVLHYKVSNSSNVLSFTLRK
jgi:hypothetical protein